MRAVIQRVSQASVETEGRVIGSIQTGLVILVAIAANDSQEDAAYLADKILNLRIFPDDAGKMNRSVLDANGALLIVSNFTVYGDCRKGRRPSFDFAASPEIANGLYEYFVSRVRTAAVKVETGIFRADMKIHLVNDGPVTLICESRVT